MSSIAVRTRYGLGSRSGAVTLNSSAAEHVARPPRTSSIDAQPSPSDPSRRRRSGEGAARRATTGARRRSGPRPRRPGACSESIDTSDSIVRVVGIGRHQVPLGGDVRPGQPTHPLAEPRSQPILRARGRAARRRRRRTAGCVPASCSAVGEHELVVGAIFDRAGRRLQRVVEFVDRILVPHPTQRAQQQPRLRQPQPWHQHTGNWSIPIVNLLFDAATLAGRTVVARDRKAQAPCA